MTIAHILALMDKEVHVYKLIWEEMYYGDRTVKDVQRLYMRASNVALSMRKNYPQ